VRTPLVSAATRVAVSRVLIFDQRIGARFALTRLVKEMSSVDNVACASDVAELLDTFAAAPAGLVLIGIQSGSTAGTDGTQRLLRRFPAARVIVYGTLNDAHALSKAIALGADGLMLWDPDQRDPATATARAMTLPRLAAAIGSATGGTRPTDRELQILRAMTAGHTNREIGLELLVSEDTVKTQARRLFHKLGARDRAHAVALALRNGLVG
jgi:DNA-binding NarL/FixJ family response regulator